MSNSMQNNYQVTGVRFLALFYAVRPRALSHRSHFPFHVNAHFYFTCQNLSLYLYSSP